jgi:alanine dehydrogenase
VRIGVPTEVKDNEFRVGMIPAAVHALTANGHQVIVQRGAGEGSGIPDEEYTAAGAELGADADEVWSRAEMVVKVKEPVAS